MKLDIKTLFDSALVMFIPVVIGFIAQKIGIIRGQATKIISAFVLKIAQPFMILTSMLGTEYSSERLYSGLTVLLAAVIIHAVAAAIAFFSTFKYSDQKKRRVAEVCMIFSNCGFFGFPLLKAVYGDVGVFWGGFFVVVFNLFLWTYGMFILSRANSEIRINPIKIFLNNGTVSCVAGFVLFLLRVKLYSPIFDSMDKIGDTCTPLSMIAIGAMIAGIPYKKLISGVTAYYASVIRLVIIPLISGLVLSFLGFSKDICVFGALMMALPCAASTAMFAENYDIEPSLASQTVGISTVLSLASVPIIMQLVNVLI